MSGVKEWLKLKVGQRNSLKKLVACAFGKK